MNDKKSDNTNRYSISYRPIREKDQDFLCQLYISTRLGELEPTGWTMEEKVKFLSQQFQFQHKDYMKNYKHAQFEIILVEGKDAGRLYVDRREDDIRIIDIALLPSFRRKGIGSRIMNRLIAEADEKKLSVSLHVEQNNPAMGLYERLGFERGKLEGVYFFMSRPPK